VESVEVRPRVSGYIEAVKFTEGAEVAKDAPLYLIDKSTYQAEFDRNTAEEKRLQELLTEILEPKYQRYRDLVGKGGVSREDFEKVAGDRLQTIAAIAAAKESTKKAKINLDWCTVRAPIAGQISMTKLTAGNLVTADTTLLTTIVSQDPMYAKFDVDENTLLAVQKRIREGKFTKEENGKVAVWLGLADDKQGGEQVYPHRGYVDLVDNKVDPGTGTIKVRGVFPNPLVKGVRALTAGLFCRIRVPVGARDKALWVPDKALVTEQGKKFVYVVNDKNIVEARPILPLKAEGTWRPVDPVKVVRTPEGSWRLAKEGEKGEDSLKVNEKIIVSGLLRVRPGMEVAPESPTAAKKAGS
jgi:RND family efflux transporter MFP subunit